MSRSNCHCPPEDLVLQVPVSAWCSRNMSPTSRTAPTDSTPTLWTSPLLNSPRPISYSKTWWVLVSGDFLVRASVELWVGKPLYSPGKMQSPSQSDWRGTRADMWRGSLLSCPWVHPFGCLCQTTDMKNGDMFGFMLHNFVNQFPMEYVWQREKDKLALKKSQVSLKEALSHQKKHWGPPEWLF